MTRRPIHGDLPEQYQGDRRAGDIDGMDSNHFEMLDQPQIQKHRQPNAGHRAQYGNNQVLLLELPQNRKAGRAQRSTDAYLTSPLSNPVARQAEHAEGGHGDEG